MRRFWEILALGAVVAAAARPALSAGLIVVVHSPERAVFAADSRVWEGPSQGYSDQACKLAAFDGAVAFAAMGDPVSAPLADEESEQTDGAAPSPEWNTYDEARRAVTEARASLAASLGGDVVAKAAEIFKAHATERLQEIFARHPEQFPQMPAGGYMLQAVFAGLDSNGDISISQLRIVPQRRPLFEVGLERITPGQPPDPLRYGRTEIVDEMLEAKTARARAERQAQLKELGAIEVANQDAFKAVRLVDLTIAYLQPDRPPDLRDAGGFVDILQVERKEGIHWVQNKTSCAEQPTTTSSLPPVHR